MSSDPVSGSREQDHLEFGSSDWLVVRNTTADDQTAEAQAALRHLARQGHLVPVPRPAAAVWEPADDARLRRNMRRLGIAGDEAAAIAGMGEATGMEDDKIWTLLLDMSGRLRRIQEAASAPPKASLEVGADNDN